MPKIISTPTFDKIKLTCNNCGTIAEFNQCEIYCKAKETTHFLLFAFRERTYKCKFYVWCPNSMCDKKIRVDKSVIDPMWAKNIKKSAIITESVRGMVNN